MYLFLQNFMDDELYSPMGPVLFAGVMAYYVASSFAGLLGMVRKRLVKLALLCFLFFCRDTKVVMPYSRCYGFIYVMI